MPDALHCRLLKICRDCYADSFAYQALWVAAAAGSSSPVTCKKATDLALVGELLPEAAGARGATVVAFRGTLDPTDRRNLADDRKRLLTILDWLHDDECLQVPFEEHHPELGRVHFGFNRAVAAIWDQIVPVIDRLIAGQPTPLILVTGHSKGGAMANIAALKIRRRWRNAQVKVVTFAGARAGDAVFAKAYDREITSSIRYEFWPDPVPELPPGPDGTTRLGRQVADAIHILGFRDLHPDVLKPYYPVGARVPAGGWLSGFKTFVSSWFGGPPPLFNPKQMLLAHAINARSGYEGLACPH
jgi:hypothetical protein